jgi:hypothetical protein
MNCQCLHFVRMETGVTLKGEIKQIHAELPLRERSIENFFGLTGVYLTNGKGSLVGLEDVKAGGL